MKKTSKAVAESRKAAGIKSTSFYLTDEERAEIDALADELNTSRKGAIMEAVRGFKSQGALTNERLLQELKRRLK